MNRAPTPPGDRTHENLRNFPPVEQWDSFVAYDAKAHPRKVAREFMLIPTTCFNCESACGLLAHVAKDDLTITKVEGNPAHPGSRGRNCAKGPATINQLDDPERILLPAAAGRPAGERPVGAGELGRGARRHRGADPVGDRRGPAQRGRCTTSAARARTASPSGSCWRGGSTATTRTPTSARPAPASATRCGAATTDRRRTTRTARRSCCCRRTSRPVTTSTRTPSGSWRRKAAGTKLVVIDPRMSNTASHADLWLAPWPGSEAAILLVRRLAPAAHEADRRATSSAGWVNWDVYLERLHPDAEPTFEVFLDRLEADYAPYTFEMAAAEAQVPAAKIAELADDRRGRRYGPVGAHLALGGRRQPRRLAGGPQPLLPQRPHRQRRHEGRHQPQRLEQVHRPRLRRARPGTPSGTSCSGRRSTRCPATRCPSCFRTSSTRTAVGSRSTSRGSTTRSGPTPTASPGWRR